MRKFFVSLLFCGMFFEGYAATYNCTVQDIGLMAIKKSNEYLFVTVAGYNHSNGLALVCGHKTTEGCANNTKVFVTGHHYHQNNPKTDACFYMCSTVNGASWDAVGSTGFSKCSSAEGKRIITTVGSNDIYVPNGDCNQYTSSGYCVSNNFCFLPHDNGQGGGQSNNDEADKTACVASGGDWTNGSCNCNFPNMKKKSNAEVCECVSKEYIRNTQAGARGCMLSGQGDDQGGGDDAAKTACVASGGTWVDSTSTCTCDKTNMQKKNGEQVCECINSTTFNSTTKECEAKKKSSLQVCLDSRQTKEGKACCYLNISVATCDKNTEKCTCVDPNLQFQIAKNGHGQCVAKGNDEENEEVNEEENEEGNEDSYTCPDNKLQILAALRVACESNTLAVNLITALIEDCKNGLTKEDFDEQYTDIQLLVPTCTTPVVDEEPKEDPEIKKQQEKSQQEKAVSLAAIKAAGKKLDDIVKGFGDANVWKNAQGEFNTARLASDSIAGVVLGTAGGLITSSVMKKKQAEQGFEDLKCVIGGQPVAGWGDEFNVGIQ